MNSAPEFQAAFVAGKPASVNGTVKGLVVPIVRGEHMPPESVRFDSRKSLAKTVTDWSERFGVNQKAIESALDGLNKVAVAKHAERAQRREQDIDKAEPISVAIDRFIRGLLPEWHREGKSIYCGKAKREIPVGSLWHLLDDAQLKIIANTKEAIESGTIDYRGCIGIARDAILIGAAKIIGQLRENADVQLDKTVVAEELKGELVGWLLKPRTFRRDDGNPVSTSYHAWASAIPADSVWIQCYTDPVFGGFSENRLTIAVKGEWLKGELRRKDARKLAADLRANGLAETDKTIRVTAKVWRIWLLSPDLFDAVATPEGE